LPIKLSTSKRPVNFGQNITYSSFHNHCHGCQLAFLNAKKWNLIFWNLKVIWQLEYLVWQYFLRRKFEFRFDSNDGHDLQRILWQNLKETSDKLTTTTVGFKIILHHNWKQNNLSVIWRVLEGFQSFEWRQLWRTYEMPNCAKC